MTIYDFIYYIGCGVSFLMGAIGLYNANRNLPKEKQSFGGVVTGAFICCALSWAVPIWWLGYEIYKRLGEKK
jgi:hypothetical protein